MNMYVSLYNNMSQPITSGNMHAQIDKSAYVRNHGHNNMGSRYAPHGGACPHKGIPLHRCQHQRTKKRDSPDEKA